MNQLQNLKSLVKAPIDCYAKSVYICISSYPQGRVSIRQISKDLQISRKKVTQSVNVMVVLGMITRDNQAVGTNRYQCIFTVKPEAEWATAKDHQPTSNVPNASITKSVNNDEKPISGGLEIAWR